MDGSLYLRIRGRVQGPFEQEKLRSLVRRGQLSRMHQLSTDGTNWQRADEFPELFSLPKAESSTDALSSPDVTDAGISKGGNAPTPIDVESQWHYAVGDRKFGPVDLATLQSLVKMGQLELTSQVWSKGMHNWATVESIANLLFDQDLNKSLPTIDTNAQPQNTHDLRHQQETTDYSQDIIRSLGDAQGWVLFIAWSGFAIAALHLLFSFLAIAFGLSKHITPFVTWGLISILHAAAIIVGATYLSIYHRHISRFVNYSKPQHLDSAMRTLHNFWMYIGIILIVLYVLAIGAAVWVLPLFLELIMNAA